VKYELEQGIYDRDRHANQIRLRPGPDKKPVVFVRAVGMVKLRYPTRIRTVTIKGKGSNDVTIDGPFVIYPSTLAVREGSLLQAIQPIRAFDGSGRQLERAPFSSSSVENGRQSQKYAFWGRIASVQVDLVETWEEVQISYELPPIAPYPASQQGHEPPTPAVIPETPGGKVTVTLTSTTEPAAEAAGSAEERVAADIAKMSREAGIAALQRAGYPDASASNFVMSAIKRDWSVVGLFLAAGLPVDALYERDHVTALYRAAEFGNVDMGLHLLAAGANPNIADDLGATVLLRAASHCDAARLVKALLAKGADVNAKSRGGDAAHDRPHESLHRQRRVTRQGRRPVAYGRRFARLRPTASRNALFGPSQQLRLPV
jgi:Ankyrin repeats (3 copies)